MKIKKIKIFTIFTAISCGILGIWDFYLAWSNVRMGNYGWALLYFILGAIILYCLKINLKTLIAIKKYNDQKRKSKRAKRDIS